MPQRETLRHHPRQRLLADAEMCSPRAFAWHAGSARHWLVPAQFQYAPLSDSAAVLEIAGRLEAALGAPAGAHLVVERAGVRTFHAATAGARGREAGHHAAGPTLWRASFEVPIEIVEFPRAIFSLTADGLPAVALGLPVLNEALIARLLRRTTAPSLARYVRRHAMALAAGLTVIGSLTAASTASAATTPTTATTPTDTTPATDTGTGTTTTTTTDTTPAPTDTTTTTTPPTDTTPAPTTTTTPTDTTPSTPAKPTTPTTPSAPPTPTTPTSTTPTTQGSKPGDPSGSGSSGKPKSTKTPSKTKSTAKTKAKAKSKKTKSTKKHTTSTHHSSSSHSHSTSTHSTKRSQTTHSIVATVSVPVDRDNDGDNDADDVYTSTSPTLSVGGNPVTIDPATAALVAQFESTTSLDQPPAYLIPIYKAAGRKYHIPWQILAAINAIETDYGKNEKTSSAGAIGWMQFEPATWAEFGFSVSGAGPADPFNPEDAIFAAAKYLAANDGAKDLRHAIWAYNHAEWYVDAVIWRAKLILAKARHEKISKHGYVLPLDAKYLKQLGRTDDGVDIEDAPNGAAVYSITPGIVTAVASDPSGFGPNYPVVLVTAGPLKGQHVYYGHVAAALVRVGEKVMAGEPIAVMGHTGDAQTMGHGHIEIGFSDEGGDPLDHGAPTASGDAMRMVLVALSHAFHIKNS